MKIYIRAMSEYDRDIRRQLVDNSKQVYQHLIKIILYPDSEYVNGWKQEIWSFIHDVDRTKRNKKFPSYKFILNALSTNLDILDNYKKIVLMKMKNSDIVPKNVPDSEISSIITKYAEWLASNLSQSGLVLDDDVYDWIDKNILNA